MAVNELHRDFKGVWIPKEIWLDQNLSWMEKLFIAEIDSLDNEKNCFASNSYFAKFFQISSSRCSQIITALKKKGYVSVELQREGKRITRRVLRILSRGTEDIKEGTKYSKEGTENTKEGYLEYCEDITYTNNTVNKKEKEVKKSTTHFIPPSPTEVTEYAKTLDFTLDGEQFCAYYEARGWMLGRVKMKSWKAAVVTWKKRDKKKPISFGVPKGEMKETDNELRAMFDKIDYTGVF